MLRRPNGNNNGLTAVLEHNTWSIPVGRLRPLLAYQIAYHGRVPLALKHLARAAVQHRAADLVPQIESRDVLLDPFDQFLERRGTEDVILGRLVEVVDEIARRLDGGFWYVESLAGPGAEDLDAYSGVF